MKRRPGATGAGEVKTSEDPFATFVNVLANLTTFCKILQILQILFVFVCGLVLGCIEAELFISVIFPAMSPVYAAEVA